MSGGGGAMFGYEQSKGRPKDLQAQEFQNLRHPLANMLNRLLGVGQGLGKDRSPLAGIPGASEEQLSVAPLTEGETAILQQLQTEGAGRQALLDQTLGGQFLPGQAGANPFLQAAIESAQRPTLEAYEQLLGRTLPGQFTQAGQSVQPGGSSPFATAAAIQSRGLASALGDIATQMSYQGYESERGRQQDAIGLSQQEVSTSIENLQAQALPRLIEQMGIDKGLAEFQRQSDTLLQILGVLGGVTQPVIGQKTDSIGIKGSGYGRGGVGPSGGGGSGG